MRDEDYELYEVDGLRIVAQKVIDFSMVTSLGRQASSFRKMKSRDDSVYVIQYDWTNPLARTYMENAEAFYIENIKNKNRDLAKHIFEKVYETLCSEYDGEKVFALSEYVAKIISKKEKHGHK